MELIVFFEWRVTRRDCLAAVSLEPSLFARTPYRGPGEGMGQEIDFSSA